MRKNTIVAQLPGTGQDWLYYLLIANGYQAFHEPMLSVTRDYDGCKTGQSWADYIHARRQCTTEMNGDRRFPFLVDAAEAIEMIEYVEVGASSLYVVDTIPATWTVLGVAMHPLSWIVLMWHELSEPTGMWIPGAPRSPEMLAATWHEHTSRIIEYADNVFRIEDVRNDARPFMQALGHYQNVAVPYATDCRDQSRNLSKSSARSEIESVQGRLWKVVKPTAEYLGYEPGVSVIP